MNALLMHPMVKRARDQIYSVGEIFFLFKMILLLSFTRPFYFKRLTEQIVNLGLGSISITIVIGLTMGAVMTLNFGYGLAKFGGTLYVPAVVSVSLVREMAPIFTSLLVAGRIGSGMAAEIGSMNVTSQIDALRALGTSPIKVLVIPRFWASIISLPLLTTISGILGIIGGLLICQTDFDIPTGFYMNKVLTSVKIHDFISGLVKSMIFGGIISVIGCYKGLTTRNGTKGVGESTTWVVVTSSILILLSDFVISKIFLVIWGH
jgi:phospholipid/cholesterol/gamma-HCH transport system permease protein